MNRCTSIKAGKTLRGPSARAAAMRHVRKKIVLVHVPRSLLVVTRLLQSAKHKRLDVKVGWNGLGRGRRQEQRRCVRRRRQEQWRRPSAWDLFRVGRTFGGVEAAQRTR